MDNLPNDVYREIMNLLDCYSICNLYMANKVFWVLPKKDIKYHRVMCKVSPHSRGHDNLMVMSPDQMSWIANVLTEESQLKIFELMLRLTCLEWTNIRIGIYPLSRRGVIGQSVYLKIWIKYDVRYVEHRTTRNQMRQYDIIIPSVELADLIMKQ